MNLEDLVREARTPAGADGWTSERAARVLTATHEARERRIVRARFVRRGLVVASVAAFFGLVLLRGAGASTPSQERAQDSRSSSPSATSEAIAVHASNDGGYARD
jgi:hypothetical protein